MVRPERFELPASWFVARRSIQLSYGRARGANINTSISQRHSDAVCRVFTVDGGEGGITRGCAAHPSLSLETAVAKALRRPSSPLRAGSSNLRFELLTLSSQ